ncbi:hypothetical protein GCM10017161_17480 [Thalassotalea marina]|uniref:Uncharacterized protein n=1 Tax=Thalassotalea marina TaxID=1673741 RepID=A0A919EKM3_9GAMM|nr:hypothetical protein GCM10017161_17480 [Thalassotalea marina]
MFTAHIPLLRFFALLLVLMPIVGHQLTVHAFSESPEVKSKQFADHGLQFENSSSDPQDTDELPPTPATSIAIIFVEKVFSNSHFNSKPTFKLHAIRAPPNFKH